MTETQIRRPMGMRAFVVIWLGQIVSILGSTMTGFAVTIWVYEGTEKATALALTGFFFVVPLLLLSPVAGAIVDRSDRKLMMMISDLAAGATTMAVLLLHLSGHLQLWHLFITNAINGAFQTFQWPAFSAAISVMLSKEQYGRASGMMELAGSGSNIFAPALAGALIGWIGLTGILIIDIVTFAFAVGALLFVHIPQPETTEAGRKGRGSLWEESFYGFRYIVERPSLLGLQLVFLLGNFVISIPLIIYAAMILARTGNDAKILGGVQSAGAIGGVVGGLIMATWGGPKRRVHGVLAGWALSGLLGTVLFGMGRSWPVWAIATFAGQFLVPIINGSNQAIWQAKVAPDVQGRVFSIRRLIAWFVNPISVLIAGPLADLALEPAMSEGGALSDALGWLVGTGPGAGMALMFILGGGLAALVGLSAYAVRVVRNAEDILPDHDSPEAKAEPTLEERPPWEVEPTRVAWSGKRKLGTAVASVATAVLIVGLGWLQVKVLTASDGMDFASNGKAVALAVSDAVFKSENQTGAIVAPTPQATQEPTPRPTSTLPPPTPSPGPTWSPPTPTTAPTEPTVLPLVAGAPLTYTLFIFNHGPSDASGVVVTDTLPAGATLGSTATSQGNGCYLGWDAVLHCELGNLANGASATITIVVTLGDSLSGPITNVAGVNASQIDPDELDNVVVQDDVVYAGADLALDVGASDLVVAGKPLTYTLTLTNNGPLRATGVTLVDALPPGLSLFAIHSDRGEDYDLDAAGVLTCHLGDLDNGEVVTAVIVLWVDSGTTGEIVHALTVAAAERDPDPSNNAVVESGDVQVEADLTIH